MSVRPRVGRLTGVLQLVTIYAWLCLLYGWEAWGLRTPWFFTDEVERAQLSRAIAATGHAARRGIAASPQSLYSYVIAPVWWIHSTNAAYGAAKAIGIAIMAASIFPAYALARMLVSRPAALLAATAVACIPALSYSSLLAIETLAYPWSVLCLWLMVRALTTPTRRWIAAAALATIAAPAMRSELQVLPLAFPAAFALFWFTGDRGRAWRRGWRIRDYAGIVALAAGVVIVSNVVASHHSTAWLIATQQYRSRIVEYGFWAAGAVAIGIGVLPLIAGLAAIFPGSWSIRPRAERAFSCVAIPAIAAYAYYTGIKAAYLSTVLTVEVAERNMIYVAPLLLVGTAIFLERRRTHPLALAGAAALAAYLIETTPYKMEFHFYADAPGLSILESANRVLAFTPHDVKIALYVLLAISFAAALAAVVVRTRVMTYVLAGAGAFVIVWNLTGEVTGARAMHEFGNQLLANFPQPYDWIDRATHREPTIFIGQRIDNDPNGIWLLEFWNRAIQGIDSTDSTTVGPGPSGYAALTKPNGTLDVDPKYQYAVTSEGVNLVGQVVASKSHLVGGRQSPWTLYRVTHPVRLLNSVEGVFPDGWFGKTRYYTKNEPGTSAYTQFATSGNRRGYFVVTVSRLGGLQSVPAHVRVRVGSVRLDATGYGFNHPVFDKVLLVRRYYARRNLYKTFVIPAPPAPFRADVRVWPLKSPHDLDPRSSDLRDLAAQVSYAFVPRKPPPEPGKPADVTGFFTDGWISSDASYTQWNAPFDLPAHIRVTVSRHNWTGPDVPSRVRIQVGSVGSRLVNGQLVFGMTDTSDMRTWTIHSGLQRTFTIPTPRPPFMVKVHIDKTFVPAKLDRRSQDTRELGAQVAFKFVPF